MVIVEKINLSSICYYSDPDIHIRDYYNYCLELLKNKILELNLKINLIFGNIDYIFENELKTYRCDIQIEHTLVKEGGRGVDLKINGCVKTDEGNTYLVRIVNLDYFKKLDLIIDYSIPNIINVKKSDIFPDLSKKYVNISPTTNEIKFGSSTRKKIISNFNFSPRRNIIWEKLCKNFPSYQNVSNCFEKQDLCNLFSESQILINIHQTEHHHTFEELRVLPALMRGVIIISENVPLKNYIPYHEYIIWSDYNNILEKTKEVSENYDFFYKKIFQSDLESLLKKIVEKNNKNLNFLKTWKVD